MIGDDDVRVGRGARRPFDEAFAIMRTARIDAFAPAIGQRGRSIAAEQCRQPTGQVAADHVAILAERRPARDKLGEDRCPAGKAAL